jgi:Zn-dependent peptidase ImmA (M78 family)/DNA-binding XRE family transcriptional regulator
VAPSPASAAVGRRIRDAREQRGWTQAELAAHLSRTPTSVSYWESGQRSPGLEEIVELADVLAIRASSLLPSKPPRVLARAQASELAIRELARVVDEVLEDYENRPPLGQVPYVSGGNPAEVAAIARRMAGIDDAPVPIEPIMDHFNVWFEDRDMPHELSGLVVFVRHSPVIVVNTKEGDVPSRQRFTAAHELGHVLLGHHDTFHVDLDRSDGFPSDYNWRQERSANDFAAALLMPAPLLRRDLENTLDPNPRKLARHYEVSEQAMSIRLSVLGLRMVAAEDALTA